MPRYLIERTFSESKNISMNKDGNKDLFIIHNSECNATWLHSYISDDRKKSFCLYDAPTPEAIRKAATRNRLPIDKITEVKILDPYFYK